MKVLICDDERIIVDECKKRLEEISKKNNIDIDIIHYSSGEFMIISQEEWINQVYIMYLDININTMNGINLAKKIRELGYNREIVFLTKSKKFAFD